MTSVFQGKGMLISGILHLSPREAYEALRALEGLTFQR